MPARVVNVEIHGQRYAVRSELEPQYVGELASYVDDKMRQILTRQPTVEQLRQLARQAGHRSLQEEGILVMALGATSLTELQRVMKQ